MSWYTEGELLNPGDQAILVDTGKIDSGNNVEASLIVSSTLPCVLIVEIQNAARLNKVKSQTIRVPGNDTKVIPLGRQVLAPGESIRVINQGLVLGSVQASIVYG